MFTAFSTHNLIVPADVGHNLNPLHSAVMQFKSLVICIYSNGTHIDSDGRAHERLKLKQRQHLAHIGCSNQHYHIVELHCTPEQPARRMTKSKKHFEMTHLIIW